MRELRFGILLVLALAVGVVGGLGWLVVRRLDALRSTHAQMDSDHHVLINLEAVLGHVSAAQSGQRDFLLTGDIAYLAACQSSLLAVGRDLQAMRKLSLAHPLDARFGQLDPLLVGQVEAFNRSLRLWHSRGKSAAMAALRDGASADSLDRIDRLAAELMQAEEFQLQAQEQAVAASDRGLTAALWLGGGVMALLFLAVPLLVGREMRRRALAEAELGQATSALKEGMQRLQRHSLEIDLLSSLIEAVQACQDTSEFAAVAGPMVQSIFSGFSGCMALLNPGKTLLVKVAHFGGVELMALSFPPQDCWAIRRGQPYLVTARLNVPVCTHLTGAKHGESFCLPLIAQAELMGLFFLASDSGRPLDQSRQKLATVVAEQMSLALANLTLRERLRAQSTRDPLTGLFNRRYMEENFDLLKARSGEANGRFAVLMADIDHFKVFNDTYGHDAGDHVLKEVSKVLHQHMRAQDILCRYGGEEMVMLLPELSVELATERAEECRKAVEAHPLSYQGRDIGRLTISMGVSVYPEDGADIEQLVKCADQALYRAKDGGRNRVVSGCLPL